MLTDYIDDSREAATDDARDDARSDAADLWRQAEAWSRLEEMDGELHRLLDGQWYAAAPSGEARRNVDGSDDHECMITSRHFARQVDAVNDCHAKWVAAGRPRALVHYWLDPNAEDGAGPFWPESEASDG